MFRLHAWKEGWERNIEREMRSIGWERKKAAWSVAALCLCAAGVAVYFQSLFVERHPVEDISTEKGDPVCAKLLVVVADGVRPDGIFVSTQTSRYCGNLPFLADAERQECGVRYAAVADLPTGTAMRVYSIFSGVPTTLLSAQRSFAAQACTCDHFLKQVLRHGKSAAFFGDSTWAQLFPEVQALPGEKSNPYGAVADKDEARLIEGALNALQKHDVVVAHLISPDSHGHIHGTDSAEVQTSLQRINAFLEKASAHLSTGPLSAIAVLSDHGVNDDGSHGGASVKERSAIFAVSFAGGRDQKEDTPHGVLGVQIGDMRARYLQEVRAKDIQGAFGLDSADFLGTRAISQNDVLPTLCALLGIPTPYNSPGSPVPELFPPEKLGSVLKQEIARKKEVLRRYVGKAATREDKGSKTAKELYSEDLALGQEVHKLFHTHSMLGMVVGTGALALGALCAALGAGISLRAPIIWGAVGLTFLVAHSMFAVIHEDLISLAGAFVALGACGLYRQSKRGNVQLGLLSLVLLVGKFPLHEMDRFWWVHWIPKIPDALRYATLGRVCICLGAVLGWTQKHVWGRVLFYAGRALKGHPSKTLLLGVPFFPAPLFLLLYSPGSAAFMEGVFCPLVEAVAEGCNAKTRSSRETAAAACALFFLLKLAFFATGHNHNLSTIGWEAAFALSKQPLPVISPILVLGELLLPHLWIVWALGAQKTEVLGGVVALQGVSAVLCCAVNFWFLKHALLWFVFSGRTIFECVFLVVLAGAYGACAVLGALMPGSDLPAVRKGKTG